MPRWSHLLVPAGAIDREHGVFRDEYRQDVDVTLRTHYLDEYVLVEQDYVHPRFGTVQRSPTLIVPLAHAFGDPSIPGVILHRITFWNGSAPARHGKLGIEDFGAENMNIKRLLEAQAGNLDSFARGRSYGPQHPASRTPALRLAAQ